MVILLHAAAFVVSAHGCLPKVGGAMNDPMSTWLGKYGLVDNITLDYFDVDTDPSGSFQAGQPYRSLGAKCTFLNHRRKTGASCPAACH